MPPLRFPKSMGIINFYGGLITRSKGYKQEGLGSNKLKISKEDLEKGFSADHVPSRSNPTASWPSLPLPPSLFLRMCLYRRVHTLECGRRVSLQCCFLDIINFLNHYI